MHARRLVAGAVSLIALSSALLTPGISARADEGDGVRPGPPILYEEPATAPQLTNAEEGPFHARPLLVSGSHAYVNGEFLYQDFLYDDTGANGRVNDPNDKHPQNDLFSLRTGTYTYPTDPPATAPPSTPRYLGNAADLVEFRVKPLADATAFRLTLTELKYPQVVAATIGIGTPKSAATAFPYGANVSGPADYFLTVHGGSATFGTSINPGATAVPVSFDQKRAQITVLVPHSAWDPGHNVVRFTAGVGLWNSATNSYLLPSQQSSATTPGGAGTLTTPPAFFNVAFRESETPASTFRFLTPQPTPTACMWRDCLQAAALASGDISSLHDDVDFAKLASGVTDRSGVPTTGSIDRIMSSHFDFGDDVTYANSASSVNPADYDGEYQGRLQPYNLFVPSTYSGDTRLPLTLLLHSLSANYNQYMDTNNQTEFGNRNGGNFVATDEARGPDGWYYDSAEADVFEMMADIAHHYDVDFSRTALTGYSMGGYATYKLGTQFPDLWDKAFVTVGPPADGIWTGPAGVPSTTGLQANDTADPTNTYYMLDSLRNLPILIWHGTNDELVPADGPQLMAHQLDTLNYRYEIDTFPGYDHFAFAEADNYTYPTSFLDGAKTNLNPPHITYVVNPTMDFKDVGVTADHAYWLSGLKVRDSSSSPRGTIDVRSEGFCVGDPTASSTTPGAGVALTPYTRVYKTWGDAPSAPCADTLDIKATNVSQVFVDAQRARIDCNAKINLTSDGPITVTIVNGDDQSACTGTVVPEAAGVAGVTTTSLSAATLPDTAAATPSAGGAGAAGAAGLGLTLLLARRARRRGWRRR